VSVREASRLRWALGRAPTRWPGAAPTRPAQWRDGRGLSLSVEKGPDHPSFGGVARPFLTLPRVMGDGRERQLLNDRTASGAALSRWPPTLAGPVYG
jgi:hypothetical protein